MLPFRVDHHDGVVVLVGEIDLAASAELTDVFAAAVEGRDAITVELDQVTFMDSSALWALLRPTTDGVTVTLRRPSDAALRLLRGADVEGRFVIDC